MTSLEDLKKNLVEDPSSFIVILGAGASMQYGLPSWNGLRDKLKQELSDVYTDPSDCKEKCKEVEDAKDNWYAFSRLKSFLGDHIYHKKVKSLLTLEKVPKGVNFYDKIWRLNTAGVINFNLDRLAENAARTSVDSATWMEPHKYREFCSTGQRFIFYPHGAVQFPDTWVLTSDEKTHLSEHSDYKKMMQIWLNTKNLLIIGFQPLEWSFTNLIDEIGFRGAVSGYHNYYLCPNAKPEDIKEIGSRGIVAIPYPAPDGNHRKLTEILDDILSYSSKDEILPSVYSGARYKTEDIPRGRDADICPVSELREILNGAIADIIPSDSTPTDDEIKRLEQFYKDYDEQIYKAWRVTKNPGSNAVYHYKVIREIGRGSFGTVYEATDENENRFALKVLKLDVTEDISYLTCFRRGIRSMKKLTECHAPGMVAIHDSYEIPACIIMDFVDGMTLREAADNRMLGPLHIKLRILQEIAKIIHNAHQMKDRILHRDLKPENIMLEGFYGASRHWDDDIPLVKILDFDLSWHQGAMAEKTVLQGSISHGFMAPELVLASTDRSLARSVAVDVYGIGMLIYYVLTGDNPLPAMPNHAHFREDTLRKIEKSGTFQWKCLPGYLRDLIVEATMTNSTERLPLDTLIGNLDIAYRMHMERIIPNTHPLLLMELAHRAEPVSKSMESSDFGRTLKVDFSPLPKKMRLETKTQGTGIQLHVTMERYLIDSDARNGIEKYLSQWKEQAVSSVDTRLFFVNRKDTDSSHSRAVVSMYTSLPDLVDLDLIQKMAENIREVRSKLDHA